MKSESIGNLAAALALAQGEIKHAIKDSDNPFFKSKYADLGSVWDACREPLSKNKLSVSQLILYENGFSFLESLLLHSSGEWLSSKYPIIPIDGKPQSLGSAITYARRYSLSSLVGIASEEDDDGNQASGIDKKPKKSWDNLPKTVPPKKSIEINPDVDFPPDSKKCLELPLFCDKHPSLKDFMGIPLFDLPLESLNSIGDIMRNGLEKSEGTKRKWYEWIINGLLEELAERSAMDFVPKQ